MSKIRLKGKHRLKRFAIKGTGERSQSRACELKREFRAFSEDGTHMSRPGNVRGEMYTMILHGLLTR